MAETSAIERIKEVDEERTRLFEHAKEEALKKATEANSDLIALGLDYQLTSGTGKARSGNAGTSGPAKDAPCPICKFLAARPHNARTHRNQKKGPFSSTELKETGLVKVRKSTKPRLRAKKKAAQICAALRSGFQKIDIIWVETHTRAVLFQLEPPRTPERSTWPLGYGRYQVPILMWFTAQQH